MPKRKYADDVQRVTFPDSGEPDRKRFYHVLCLPENVGRIECDLPEGVFNGPDGNPIQFKCEKCDGAIRFKEA